jgi:RimJ/RimL family protein N-acetyltransferase
MGFRIEGKLVTLRPLVEADIDDYERWNNPASHALLYDGPWYNEDLSKFIEGRKKRLSQGYPAPYHTLEIDTKDGRHIGWANAYYGERDPHATEIGISIHADELWGEGIGTEVCSLWIDYLFKELNLTRIGFTTWQGNPGMLKVGMKLGFVEEARRRKSCVVRGEFYDRVSMGILRQEWEARKQWSPLPIIE